MSTLRKKSFSRAPVKCFSLYGSNNSDSVVFGNAVFGEIKGHSLKTITFQKQISYRSFGFVFTLRKKAFSRAPVEWFSHYGSNNSDSVVFENGGFAEIKVHSLSITPFQKKLSMEVLDLCLPYVKRYFQEHQWSAFLFMAQITQMLLSFRMLLLDRSKITVEEQYLSKKKICYWSFSYVSTLRKKAFLGEPVKCFSLYGSNNLDSVVFENAATGEVKDHSFRTTPFLK